MAMTKAVFGIYQNGQITIDEALPIRSGKAKVVVTVVEEISDEQPIKPRRQLGLLKGQIRTENGFNDPIDDSNDYM